MPSPEGYTKAEMRTFCLGHVVPQRLRYLDGTGVPIGYYCTECAADGKNPSCPSYKPIKIAVIEVE